MFHLFTLWSTLASTGCLRGSFTVKEWWGFEAGFLRSWSHIIILSCRRMDVWNPKVKAINLNEFWHLAICNLSFDSVVCLISIKWFITVQHVYMRFLADTWKICFRRNKNTTQVLKVYSNQLHRIQCWIFKVFKLLKYGHVDLEPDFWILCTVQHLTLHFHLQDMITLNPGPLDANEKPNLLHTMVHLSHLCLLCCVFSLETLWCTLLAVFWNSFTWWQHLL